LCSDPAPPMRYWIRRDIKIGASTAERRFLDRLQKEVLIETIQEELSTCTQIVSCGYIARNVYRFIPEMRKSGQFDRVLALFGDPGDRAMLLGWRDARAHKSILKELGNQ
jgi:hypothetical protein